VAAGTTVVSVGAESTAVALRHARHAESKGASAVMATPPGLHRVGDDELLRYFLDIAGCVSVPLIMATHPLVVRQRASRGWPRTAVGLPPR